MKKIKFNHMLALVSTMSMVAGSQSVYAQQSEAAEEVVITGFKASLEKAQEVKKASSSIVEAIAAEDIGKLPDTSIQNLWRACQVWQVNVAMVVPVVCLFAVLMKTMLRLP